MRFTLGGVLFEYRFPFTINRVSQVEKAEFFSVSDLLDVVAHSLCPEGVSVLLYSEDWSDARTGPEWDRICETYQVCKGDKVLVLRVNREEDGLMMLSTVGSKKIVVQVYKNGKLIAW